MIIPAAGLLLSAYAYYVERNAKNKQFKALCDINSTISCSKVFSSKYGRLLGVPNALLGIAFYSVVLLLSFLELDGFVRLLAIPAVAASAYLSLLQFKLRTFCLVCTAIYVVNIALLF